MSDLRKSPDAAGTGSGHGQGDETSMPEPTLQPIAVRPNVDAVERMRVELGTTIPELIGERLEDARTEFIEAMKLADDSEHREYHVRLGEIVNQIDALRRELAERHGGS